jgi:hypothetical protein
LRLEALEGRELLAPIITTFAGKREAGFGGDGGPAALAQLDEPSGVTVDANGNVFTVDDFNERIRKVTPAGIISTFAGNGTVGDDGDGGPATNATFQFGSGGGVGVDAQGDVFIADPTKGRVRKVTPDGIIRAFAGTSDFQGGQGTNGDGGPATSAELAAPFAVAVDAQGDAFIADSGENLIRKVTPDGIIHTVAGTPRPLSEPPANSAATAGTPPAPKSIRPPTWRSTPAATSSSSTATTTASAR